MILLDTTCSSFKPDFRTRSTCSACTWLWSASARLHEPPSSSRTRSRTPVSNLHSDSQCSTAPCCNWDDLLQAITARRTTFSSVCSWSWRRTRSRFQRRCPKTSWSSTATFSSRYYCITSAERFVYVISTRVLYWMMFCLRSTLEWRITWRVRACSFVWQTTSASFRHVRFTCFFHALLIITLV